MTLKFLKAQIHEVVPHLLITREHVVPVFYFFMSDEESHGLELILSMHSMINAVISIAEIEAF